MLAALKKKPKLPIMLVLVLLLVLVRVQVRVRVLVMGAWVCRHMHIRLYGLIHIRIGVLNLEKKKKLFGV